MELSSQLGMKLSEEEIQTILRMVQKEPRTVQEIAQTIDRSWVTTEKYLQELKEKTGQISLKTFREGTQAALKIVHYSDSTLTIGDEVKQALAQQIITGKQKTDFDFMEIFQFVRENEKRAHTYDSLKPESSIAKETANNPAKETAFVFSGNLSYISYNYKGRNMVDMIEGELEAGAHIRILSRVNMSSLSNIEKVSHLLVKYPNQFEIRHRYQPLRGVLVDGKFARFRNEERMENYREGELEKNTRIYYEITSNEWITWLESVFWSMWRSSIPYDQRIKEIQKISRTQTMPSEPIFSLSSSRDAISQ